MLLFTFKEVNMTEVMQEQSEGVAATNHKVLGDGPAFYSTILMSNAASQ